MKATQTLLSLFALSSASALQAAALCSTLSAPSVQIHLKSDASVPLSDIQLQLTTADDAGTLIALERGVDFDGSGDFILSPVLPAGQYTLNLLVNDSLVLSESVSLKKSAACYVGPFVETYTCSEKDGSLHCGRS